MTIRNFDSPVDIANAYASHFSYTGSSENYHSIFLTIKGATEL